MSVIASNKYTLILGMGLTGQSCVRYLLSKGIRVVVCDSREAPPSLEAFKQEFPDVPVQTGPWDESALLGASEIVISPGLSRKTPAIKKAIAAGVPVIGDIELFARQVSKPVIAITGSNGKTTVTTLVGEMVRAAGLKVIVAGNIGTPVLDTLNNPNTSEREPDIYVLELSSFQLESLTSLRPVACTVLNVSADHMDRYANLMEYALTKQRIAFGAKHVIANKQDPLTEVPMAEGARRSCFGLGQPDLKDFGVFDGHIYKGLKPLVAVEELKIVGEHNYLNAAAALALVDAAGIDLTAAISALKDFSGLPHRCQFVAEKNGVRFINDSKATNVGATVAAIRGLAADKPNLHIVLGGDGKGADFSPLVQALSGTTTSVALIGKDAPKLAEVLASTSNLNIGRCTDLAEAVQYLVGFAQPGDIVLLSPACASLDMFKNFEARGEAFREAVMAL